MKHKSWRTRFGFYLVAISSACGLGNMWRFPYVVGENGGGAFVLLYAFLAFVIGTAFVITELVLGRSQKASVMRATLNLQIKHKKPYAWSGRFAVLMSLVVLSYYSVIAGWVLYFIIRFTLGMFTLEKGMVGGFAPLMNTGLLQWTLASVHLLIALFVILKGVQEGLERWISRIAPVFALLVIILVWQTLSFASSADVYRFLFYPDFSSLSLSSLNHALSHVLFTLSVGFGTLVTFGSYLRDEDHLPTLGFRLTVVDTIVSLVVVLLIFPIAFEVANVPLSDPSLMFETLPQFLLSIKGGLFFGLIFFVSLYFAALNASIGLFETVVSNLSETAGIQRKTSAWISGLFILTFALLPAFSSSTLKAVRFGNHSLIEQMDSLLINWALPLIALFLVWSIRKGLGEEILKKNFIDQQKPVSIAMWSHYLFVLKWVIPAIIVLGLIFQAFDLFLKIHA